MCRNVNVHLSIPFSKVYVIVCNSIWGIFSTFNSNCRPFEIKIRMMFEYYIHFVARKSVFFLFGKKYGYYEATASFRADRFDGSNTISFNTYIFFVNISIYITAVIYENNCWTKHEIPDVISTHTHTHKHLLHGCHCCYYNSMRVVCVCWFFSIVFHTYIYSGDPSKCQTELRELGMA